MDETPESPHHVEAWLPEILNGFRREGFAGLIKAWMACWASAPAADPQMAELCGRTEFVPVWCGMILALERMPDQERWSRLTEGGLRYWLPRLAEAAKPRIGELAPIWMAWRDIQRKMEGMTQ